MTLETVFAGHCEAIPVRMGTCFSKSSAKMRKTYERYEQI